ncbi:MAG: DUF4178 domain-containing protein [Gemmatimonadota bacterium]|nr:DUF4178 domain-containing protein [Gemmatimonadota bacterium]HEU4988477.1 DUF4178 domain-containing protein [Gemmatimonadaceae bacterium]
MSALTASCPNCGAAIHFDWSHAVQTSCPFCRSVIVRGDVDLKTVGTVGDFPATSSPLQIGTTGAFHGRPFAVVGRVVYGYERGSWNAWHVRFDDGQGGWLSDARGEYAFTIGVSGADVPAADALHIGGNFAWQGRIYKVMAVTSVRYRAVEGELPFTTWDRQEATLADLDANDGHIATIDYRGRPPSLALGEWMGFDDLALDHLREIDGWPLPA